MHWNPKASLRPPIPLPRDESRSEFIPKAQVRKSLRVRSRAAILPPAAAVIPVKAGIDEQGRPKPDEAVFMDPAQARDDEVQ